MSPGIDVAKPEDFNPWGFDATGTLAVAKLVGDAWWRGRVVPLAEKETN